MHVRCCLPHLPALLDLELNPTPEATMHTTSRPRPRAASPARPAGLLGTYPVPELHLVGAPVPDNPRSPIQWQPAPPPLQYGIDYTFMHRAGREPVRWQHS